MKMFLSMSVESSLGLCLSHCHPPTICTLKSLASFSQLLISIGKLLISIGKLLLGPTILAEQALFPSFSSQGKCCSPLTFSVTPHWTLPVYQYLFMLHQPKLQCFKWCQRRNEPLICWLRLLLVQPRMLLVIFAARADLVHVQLGAYKIHKVFCSRAAPQTVSPQHVSLQGVLPSQMQDFLLFKFPSKEIS